MAVNQPASIGPYAVIRRLGSGGMAEVWLAHALGASGFRRLVAIKRPLPSTQEHDEAQRLLIAEAAVGGRMHHRNLVAVHRLGLHEGAYYMVMDYVDGPHLGRLVAQTPLSAELAIHVVGEVLLGLHHLHHLCDDKSRPLGLVHRDISPSNVLVSRSGEVKLADYGIAKATVLAGNTAANIRRGKYAYMSPEQVAGEPLDGRSDQFGVGVMLAELLTGTRPFDGPGPAQILDRIREATPPMLPGVAAPLAAVVRRSVSRDPADRFDDALALRDALLDAAPGGIRVGPPQLAERVDAWVCANLDEHGNTNSRKTKQTIVDLDP